MDIGYACRLIIGLLLMFAEYASSLECWKCLADNCEIDPDGNYKAGKMTCLARDSACMTVEYMYIFKTNRSERLYTSVIRTCSAGPCVPIDDAQFDECKGKRVFQARGCVKRTCCDDRDLCNKGHSDVMSLWVLIFVVCSGYIWDGYSG